jgi:uncharacterized sodium:solute symporter family permease YidK
MSKKKRELKARQQAVQEARKLSMGKVVRLTLKMLVFALLASFVVTFAAEMGVPYLDNFWTQVLVMVLLYIPAYPIVMSEFRPKRAGTGRSK